MSVLKTNKYDQTKRPALREMLIMAKRFGRNEDGSMTIFAVFIFLMMLLVSGISVDLMRNEMDRARLQNAIDRATLAAADLDQKLVPKEVVEDYFEKSGLGDVDSIITVDDGLNFRTVTVTAAAATQTQFMKNLGVDQLRSPVRSSAEERISNVEISLVLDISGSMAQNNRISNLRDAATVFVETVIREDTTDLISVSLVPYTAQTNAGKAIFDEMNITELHSYSYCVDFEESDFEETGLDLDREYLHMQHFEKSSRNYGSNTPINNPGCPKRSYEEIQPISQNLAELKNTISNYTARANTASNLGMKWGVALLDPSFQPVTQALSAKGDIDTVFFDRPSNYADPETLKTIVLMTDGANVDTYRIADNLYDSPSDRAHWNYNALDYYLSRYVRSSNWPWWRYVKYTATQADSMLSNICSAAKSNGVVIWSVGFEVSDRNADKMEACASSPSHFFRVEGIEITEAFSAIASQINQLRLVQ